MTRSEFPTRAGNRRQPRPRLAAWCSMLLLTALCAGSSCPAGAPGLLAAPPVILDSDHFLGPADAPLTVVEYASPQCYWCRQFAASEFATIRQRFIDSGQVRWVFRYAFPVNNAEVFRAASGIECAADQGAHFDYWERVFTDSTDFSASALGQLATDLGLDRTAFDACMAGGDRTPRVRQDVESGGALGVRVTPTFFVGTEVVQGFHTAEELGAIIQSRLDQLAGA